MPDSQLFCSDNLMVLQQLPPESIDIVYLDPPFFTNRTHTTAQHHFSDEWQNLSTYIHWLYERVAAIHKLMKPTATIYLHCDWHADAYIRVEILDKIFGYPNYLNQIVWHYVMGSSAQRNWGRKYDTIYWYAKNHNKYHFDLAAIKTPYNPETIARSQRGEARYKTQLTEQDGKNPGNVWIDIHPVQGNSRESWHYPTQKPEKLLQRLLLAASREGDVLLDPFVGSGTSLVVAQQLNRQWIGIDESQEAIALCKKRLIIPEV